MGAMKRKRTTQEETGPGLAKREKIMLPTGCEWDRGRLLGQGGFGSVYLASVKKPKLCPKGLPTVMAVKSAWDWKLVDLMMESSVLEELGDCPFVITRYGEESTVGDDGNEMFNLFLEYADGGTMWDLVEKSGDLGLREAQVRKYTESILKGIKYIHEIGYVHRDVKPENILLVTTDTGFVPKIGDLGLAKWAGRGEQKDWGSSCWQGTPMYLSPEAVIDGVQEKPCDIWALGCVVLVMLTARQPWDVKGDRKLLMTPIASESPIIPDWLSEEAKDFLGKCFVRNPSARFTAAMLLNHPFVTSKLDQGKVGQVEAVEPKKEVVSLASSSSSSPSSLSNVMLGFNTLESGAMQKHWQSCTLQQGIIQGL